MTFNPIAALNILECKNIILEEKPNALDLGSQTASIDNTFIKNLGYNYNIQILPPKYNINSKKISDKLIIKYFKNNQEFSQLSGAEKAVFNIAVQTSLGKLLNNYTPPLQILDEAFSSLDEKHLQEIPKILNFIKSQFDLIIYISHNHFIKNKADYSILVNKKNNISYFECKY